MIQCFIIVAFKNIKQQSFSSFFNTSKKEIATSFRLQLSSKNVKFQPLVQNRIPHFKIGFQKAKTVSIQTMTFYTQKRKRKYY